MISDWSLQLEVQGIKGTVIEKMEVSEGNANEGDVYQVEDGKESSGG